MFLQHLPAVSYSGFLCAGPAKRSRSTLHCPPPPLGNERNPAVGQILDRSRGWGGSTKDMSQEEFFMP